MEEAQTGFISDRILTLETHRYEAAKARALSYGIIIYRPAADIALRESPEDIYERVMLLMQNTSLERLPKKADVDALLGGVDRPHFEKLTVSQAFALYVDKIALDDQRQKDVDQRRNWLKSKKTSIAYFISQSGIYP